ncbi:unnamed protein product [Cylicocyclus nassatus]|uniref:DNA polymerase epsilon subunit 3 n=1 Tax=Cylicocyclus nassatus TaxID=53992 RepID=A0AA36M6R6_CYLNA|nr:unnamed protein product [Cylicocyclus nassatus]
MSNSKAEELRLPMAVLSRVIKSSLPSGAAVSKDARTHIMRACAVFILYLVTQAEDHTTSKKRKTVNVEDVMVGLKTAGFETIHEALHDAFESYKASRASKAKHTRKHPTTSRSTQESEDSHDVERPSRQGMLDDVDIEDLSTATV